MKKRRCSAKPATALAALTVAALVTGCGANNAHSTTAPRTRASHASASSSSGRTASAPPSSTTSATGAPAGARPTKVLTFIEENHSLAQMQAGMPYLDGLANQYSYAADFTAITHPSLPNYLAIAGGSTFGVSDDGPPSVNAAKVGTAPSVFDQALARGATAKTYAESMPSNCDTSSTGLYAVKHNPWAYFSAGQADCRRFDVPSGDPSSGALATDIAQGTLPNVGMVIPNLCDDAHNDSCSLTTADDWLRGWLPQILRSRDFTSGRLVVVITADEDDHSMGNTILTVVLDAEAPRGQVVHTALDHYSLSQLYSDVVGAPPLANAARAASMRKAFGL